MTILYFIIGYLIAGAHFSWAQQNAEPEKWSDMMSPGFRNGFISIFLVGPFWPIYLTMMVGAYIFRTKLRG